MTRTAPTAKWRVSDLAAARGVTPASVRTALYRAGLKDEWPSKGIPRPDGHDGRQPLWSTGRADVAAWMRVSL